MPYNPLVFQCKKHLGRSQRHLLFILRHGLGRQSKKTCCQQQPVFPELRTFVNCSSQVQHQVACMQQYASNCHEIFAFVKRGYPFEGFFGPAPILVHITHYKLRVSPPRLFCRQLLNSISRTLALQGRVGISVLTNSPHRFSAFWLRSKCSICSYQLNI